MIELWAHRFKKCDDNIINRVNVDFVKNNCTFGDVGQLNLAFRDFNGSWNTELGYTKNFAFKPGTVNIIKDIMSHSLYLQTAQKKAMKTIFNNYTENRWRMSRLNSDYNTLNDKLIQMRSSGFKIVDFEREVVEIPGKFKEAMDNWNTTLAPMGARVGIMNGQSNDDTIHDSNLNLVYTIEIPDIILQVYGREHDTSNKIADIPLNGGARIAWVTRLGQSLDNFGTMSQGRSVRGSYYHANIYGEKMGMPSNIYHPFINYRQDAHVCTGDLTQQLRDHFNSFRFVELTMLIHTWLTNFEHGRTYPLNPINKSFFGMPKAFGNDFAAKVGQDTSLCYTRMINEYEFYDTIAKECDDMECVLKDKCNGYTQCSDEEKQIEQREREERTLLANQWIEDICEQYEEDNGFYVDEEMYEWLFECARTHGRDAAELVVLGAINERKLRESLNAFCRGGLNNLDWIKEGPRSEWGDLYSAIKSHPDFELHTQSSDRLNPLTPDDTWSFLSILLVCEGIDSLQDFLIESLDLYHEKTLTLKPTEISRKFENKKTDDEIRREMETWATAMEASSQPSIMPEQPVEVGQWNPLDSITANNRREDNSEPPTSYSNNDGEPLF